MPWNIAGGFLERFKNIKPPKKFIQDEVVKVIQNVLGFSVDAGEVEERSGVLYIKTKNHSLKNEIFMKREKILEELFNRLGKKSPKEIRF